MDPRQEWVARAAGRVVAGLTVVTLLTFGASAAMASEGAAEEPVAAIEQLAFMAGCWQGDLGGGASIRETFTAPRGGAMLGNSQMVAGGVTRSFEFIRIEQTAAGVVYRPYPSGKETVTFSLAYASATDAVFENPGHDFPQRIAYRLKLGGELIARIERMDGKGAQTFAMKAVPCGGDPYRSAFAEGGS